MILLLLLLFFYFIGNKNILLKKNWKFNKESKAYTGHIPLVQIKLHKQIL